MSTASKRLHNSAKCQGILTLTSIPLPVLCTLRFQSFALFLPPGSRFQSWLDAGSTLYFALLFGEENRTECLVRRVKSSMSDLGALRRTHKAEASLSTWKPEKASGKCIPQINSCVVSLHRNRQILDIT